MTYLTHTLQDIIQRAIENAFKQLLLEGLAFLEKDKKIAELEATIERLKGEIE